MHSLNSRQLFLKNHLQLNSPGEKPEVVPIVKKEKNYPGTQTIQAHISCPCVVQVDSEICQPALARDTMSTLQLRRKGCFTFKLPGCPAKFEHLFFRKILDLPSIIDRS